MIKLDNLTTRYQTRNDCWGDGKLLQPVKGIMVHSTATPGVMARRFADSWDNAGIPKAVHAFVDDREIVQCFDWNKRCWHAGVGELGLSANNTHIGFEICEPSGHHYDAGKGARMFDYDVAKNKPYFNNIWTNSVMLCAYLCQVFKLNPLKDIICHSEGYEQGIASGHGDTMHWFPYHGKDMNAFRGEVKAAMDKENPPKPQTDNIPDMYAKDAVDWAIANDVLMGDLNGDYKLHSPVTVQNCLVFIKRALEINK